MTPEIWFVALIAVSVLDALLTLYALRLGAAEANPLLRALMRRVRPALALLLIKGAYIVAVGSLMAQIAPWLPWLVAFFAAVCVWNVAQIVRMRKTTPGDPG